MIRKYLSSPAFSIFSAPVNGFQMNYYLLQCNKTNSFAVIDSGFSSQLEFQTLLTHLDSLSFTKASQITLLQTHAHIDHILGVNFSLNHFKNSKIHVHSLEKPNWDTCETRALEFGFEVPDPPKSLDSFIKSDRITLLDPYILNKTAIHIGDLTLKTYHTPGHAPGHVVFFLESNQTKILFGGDMIFQGGVGRTDLPFCDPSAMTSSLQFIVDTFPDETLIFSGHGPPTTLHQEKSTNPFLTR